MRGSLPPAFTGFVTTPPIPAPETADKFLVDLYDEAPTDEEQVDARLTSLLTKAIGAAAAVTASSSALARRFGGTVIPHGCLTDCFEPAGAVQQPRFIGRWERFYGITAEWLAVKQG